MEKSMECSENAITNTGKTPIAVKNAVFILSSDTIWALAFQEGKSTATMINGITHQLLDAATQDAWTVKTSPRCLRENISACHARSVTTALSCELTANTMINMTAPNLEKLIRVILELHV
jgi:hypothetical protein